MNADQQLLFVKLQQLHIKTQLYEHEPLFTVEQAQKVTSSIPGAGVKNLFLKDNKKKLWLIVALANQKIELKKVSKQIQAPELRFADPQLLKDILGVVPGSVTPLAVINDVDHKVTVLLDKNILDCDLIGVHPLRNDATVTITPQDVKRFIEACGNELIVYDFNIQ